MSELLRLAPATQILVRSDRPSWLYPDGVRGHNVRVDVGMVQQDSLTILVGPTLAEARAFEEARPRLVTAEAEALAGYHPRAIVADIPPLAFDVAAMLGVPSIGVANFSWDWIYAHLDPVGGSDGPIVFPIRRSEASATLLLRLPLHGDMSAFPCIEDISLIARVAQRRRELVRAELGLGTAVPLALLSFSGAELDRIDFAALGRLTYIQFVVTAARPGRPLPPNVLVGPRDPGRYHDLLGACDVVLMKPGYGTVADCLANRVPMVYATRPGFVEEQVLVPAMHRLGRAVPIEQSALFSGQVEPAIEAALAMTSPWQPLAVDGAEVAARRILQLAGLDCES
jgi:L-arabinokinase